MTIPTYREASDRRCEGQATKIDIFITEHQPNPPEDLNWRTDLLNVIREAEWREREIVTHESMVEYEEEMDSMERTHATQIENLLRINKFLRRRVLALMAAFLIQLVSAGIFLWMIT